MQTCFAAVGVVSDIYRQAGPAAAPYTKEFMEHLMGALSVGFTLFYVFLFAELDTRPALLNGDSQFLSLRFCPSRCPTLTEVSSPRSSLPLATSPLQWVREAALLWTRLRHNEMIYFLARHPYSPDFSNVRPGPQIRPHLEMIFNVLRAACPYAVKPEVRTIQKGGSYTSCFLGRHITIR